VTFGIISDKKLLFEGRPTQIVSNEERRALDELMPELVKEAARRGIALELPPMIEVEWRETKNPEGEDKSGGAI